MTIYIVEGSTGEYSDHIEWLVKAYADEQKAQSHVLLAQSRANELAANEPNRYGLNVGLNEYDPGMQLDYTGTHYTVIPVEYEP